MAVICESAAELFESFANRHESVAGLGEKQLHACHIQKSFF